MTFDKVADRVRKLRALSESSNPHEAAAAAAEAQRLILEHQLDPETLATDAGAVGLVEEDVLPLVDRHEAIVWEELLASAVAYANGCATVAILDEDSDSHLAYCLTGDESLKVLRELRVVGSHDGVAGVRLLFPILHAELRRIGRLWVSTHDADGICDFMLGAATTVATRLIKERQTAMAGLSGSATALVAVTAGKIEDFMRTRGFHKNTINPEIRDGRSFDAGAEAGRAVETSVGPQRQGERRQLTGG